MARQRRKSDLYVGATFLALVVALGLGLRGLENTAAAEARSAVTAPRFEVDPFWPKPLPNHWLLGSTIGLSVDAQDHVWIVHRGGSTLNARTEMLAPSGGA